MPVGFPAVRLHRDSSGRTRKKVYEAALRGSVVYREHGTAAAIEYYRSSRYRGSTFAVLDALLAVMLMEACTRSEILEGIGLAEAVRSSTTGDAPARVLETRLASVVELAVVRAWVHDLGDPGRALELLERSRTSWADNPYPADVVEVSVLLAQVEPRRRSEGVALATALLFSGADWLAQFDEATRGEAANRMALALVQVPMSDRGLISEAERLALVARASTRPDWAAATAHTLALVRIRQGRVDEAVSLLRPLLADEELTPRNHDDVLITLALALTMLGEVDEALGLVEGGRRTELLPPVLGELRASLAASASDRDAI
jgi:hypothetical protein